MGGQISLVASLVLTFLLLLPSQGWAQEQEGDVKTTADGFKYMVNDHWEAKIVGFDQTKLPQSSDELVIPSMIESGYDHYFVTQFGPDDRNGDGVFQNVWAGMEEMKISFLESTMPMEGLTIKSSAFKGLRCKEVVLPSSNNVTIEEDAFNNCQIGCVTFTNDHPMSYGSPGDDEAPRYHTSMFMNIDDIQKVVIPGWTEIYYSILSGCSNVSVSGSDPVPGIGSTKVGDFYAELDEDNHTAKITGVADSYSSSSLTITSTVSYNGKSYTVTAIDDNAFKGNSFSSITIPSTVTSIGENAFAESNGENYGDFSELTVYLNYEGTDLSNYASSMFSDFKGNLISIVVPEANGDEYLSLFSNTSVKDKVYVTRSHVSLSDANSTVLKGYYPAGSFIYTRTLSAEEQAGGYVTCALPFPIDASASEYNDMFDAIYTVGETITKKADSRYYLKLNNMMDKTEYEAYVSPRYPMLLKLKSGVTEFAFKNASPMMAEGGAREIPTTLTVKDEQGNPLTDYTMQLCGSKEKKTDCSDIYSFNPDGTFGKHKYDALNPFRMYLKVTSNNNISANSPVFYSSINPNGGTTGINAVRTDAAQKSALIYSIDGKLVSSNGSTAGLAKGVYIQNGKKVVVK